MLTKLLNCYSLYIADYPSIISDVLKEKPISTTLLPIITIIFIYYIYTYVRKFYPITVNCWFCNSNFSVPYENKSEFTCSQCGQFNGFKDDGSYSKEILEQHDEILNNDHFVVSQNNTKENKNGLCNRCNIIQEIKIKQLASFTPSKEKYFDKEIDAFKNNLEKTLKLCHKCDLYTKKILFIQQQRYSLKQISNRFQTLTYNSLKWPLISSICLSILNVLFIFHIENDLGTKFFKYLSLTFLNNNIITTDQLIIITCIFGSTLLIYQNFMELEILNLITMFCWFLLTIVNIFHIFEDYAIKLVLITFDILIPTYTLMISFTTKRNDSTNIKIIDQNCSSSPFDTRKDISPKSYLWENHYQPGSSNEFIVRLPRFKVAHVLNKKIFLEAISKPIQYTTRDEYDNILEAQNLISQKKNVKMNPLKIVIPQK
ncbi:uncharacterized protein LOC126904505 isoform X2 [Daktulosphaira vitifoliae]|uniref:uncharacterized protein LOC126904505 isoform X2 n=1 Tax=Daktulosphaira vitifoliae TaxID=58002 RepID=UPI0021A9F9C7|nr:uncharacterized protein LOC126904505 isoform X2 [Daktulosphaira vitifoliae]